MKLYSLQDVVDLTYKNLSEDYAKIFFRDNIVTQGRGYSYDEYTITVPKKDLEKILNDDALKQQYFSVAKSIDKEREKEEEISSLKYQLCNNDYKVIKNLEKFSLGLPADPTYGSLLLKRQKARDTINNIELDLTDAQSQLEQLKTRKINEMCFNSQRSITNGVDFNGKHYRLNTTDQINLSFLNILAQQGKAVPYHADGEVCRIFEPNEILELSQMALNWVIYHTTYFNLLKHQILNMTDATEIENVTYGMQLNEEYNQILTSLTSEDAVEL